MAKHSCLDFFAVIPALILALAIQSFALPRQMEALDRGLLVSNVGKSGMLVSWRLLGTEKSDTEFNLYRDGVKIATIGKTDGTNYLDKDGKITSKYTVSAVVDSVEGDKKNATVVFDSTVAFGGRSFPYKVLTLDRPANQTMPDGIICGYYPDDISVGDLDGDGEYELVVKWMPSNFKDNAQSSEGSYTGTVFIDAYELDGTKLWRVDLGRNIRAGAHYVQFQVYDYDGDGKAEMVVKTADGTIDGKGKVIGDSSKDYRNAAGIIVEGPEYLTVFNGADGAEITTIDFVPPRSIRKFDMSPEGWGDTYGNRCDRFFGATAYLDGVHPSVIIARGNYTAAYVVAYDFDGKNLKLRWFHKSETPGEGLYGQGNLNIAVGDVDGDGKDEIIYGAAALNHDGTLRYSTGLGYGFAGHLGDLDPDHPGLEFWAVHSPTDGKYSAELRDGDGKILFGDAPPSTKENGRAMAADIDSTHRGYEMWSAVIPVMHTAKGDTIELDESLTPEPDAFGSHYMGSVVPTNFRIYFDGDLQDELLDSSYVAKFNSVDKTIGTYFDGATVLGLSGNYNRRFPSLVADLFGDWREELILRSNRDSSKIYILSTPEATPYRLYTLMHDVVYREAIAWQNTAYNQPPHTSYYLPDMVENLKTPVIYTVGDNEYVVSPDAVLTKTGSGKEKQTVTVGESIKSFGYDYLFCTGVKVEGLPSGVSAKVDSAAQTVKISGTPKKSGTFKFKVTTVGSKAENVTVKGEIVVKEAAKPDTSKVDTSKTDTKDSSKTTPKDSSKVVMVDTSVVDAAKPYEGDGSTKKDNKGYTGKGYFDFKDSKSSYATWLIKSSSKSSTTVSIRYANGGDASRDMTLVVNDEDVGTVKMGKTGGWSKWKTSDIKIKLKKGKNTITLKSTTKTGGANVDAFFFDIAGVELYTDKKNSDALPVVQMSDGFFYRPLTGTLFTSVSGFVEVLFYDASGTMRAAVSGNVSAGESEMALERGVLPGGTYIVKVKRGGKLMQKSLFVNP
jgi:rhamnogalacturonan endolyase